MRNVKILTTQDHVLVFIECTEENDEITCVNRTTNMRSFPPPFTAFGLKGTFRQFRKDGSGEWQATRTSTAPMLLFRTDDVEAGHVSVSNTSLVGILPKKKEYLNNWISTLGEGSVNSAIESSRESYSVITEGTTIRKMDANNFVELAPEIDDEIVFE
jgi:hypothetical protein